MSTSEPACESREQLRTLFTSGSTLGISDRQFLEAFAHKNGRASELGFEAPKAAAKQLEEKP